MKGKKCEYDDLKRWFIDKNGDLMFRRNEMLQEKMEVFPILNDERVRGFKEKDSVQNTWEKVAESLDFTENGNFIRASRNWEYFEDSCSKKIGALFCVRNSYKILASQLIWISVDWQFKTVLPNNN